MYQWLQTFFGLPTNYRKEFHDNIFSLIYYSNGGFSHHDVYTMPVYLRRFYTNTLIETKKQENKQQEDSVKQIKQQQKVMQSRAKRGR